MCAGSLLANRELYLVFLRMLNRSEILQDSEVETHPVLGSADPTSLVTKRVQGYLQAKEQGRIEGGVE